MNYSDSFIYDQFMEVFLFSHQMAMFAFRPFHKQKRQSRSPKLLVMKQEKNSYLKILPRQSTYFQNERDRIITLNVFAVLIGRGIRAVVKIVRLIPSLYDAAICCNLHIRATISTLCTYAYRYFSRPSAPVWQRAVAQLRFPQAIFD